MTAPGEIVERLAALPKRNWSMQSAVIPDGSTVVGMNFCQANPDTDCISGKDLTFRECNLINVRLDPSWKIECCNTAKILREVTDGVTDENGNVTLTIAHQWINPKTGLAELVQTDEVVCKEADLDATTAKLTDAAVCAAVAKVAPIREG